MFFFAKVWPVPNSYMYSIVNLKMWFYLVQMSGIMSYQNKSLTTWKYYVIIICIVIRLSHWHTPSCQSWKPQILYIITLFHVFSLSFIYDHLFLLLHTTYDTSLPSYVTHLLLMSNIGFFYEKCIVPSYWQSPWQFLTKYILAVSFLVASFLFQQYYCSKDPVVLFCKLNWFWKVS